TQNEKSRPVKNSIQDGNVAEICPPSAHAIFTWHYSPRYNAAASGFHCPCFEMIFRKLRKFLKPKLKRHPVALRVYEAVSWALTRSAFSPKHFFPTMIALLFPMWIAPRCRLALHYVGECKFNKAIGIANDVLARKPEAYLDDDTFNRLAVAF